MFSHIMVGSDDIPSSKKFYDAIFCTLGVNPGVIDDRGRPVYATPSGVFIVSTPINGKPASAANGATVAFAAKSAEEIDAWHAAGLANGGTSCEDPPGIRRSTYGEMYVAYLRDGTGNKLCAVFRVPSLKS